MHCSSIQNRSISHLTVLKCILMDASNIIVLKTADAVLILDGYAQRVNDK